MPKKRIVFGVIDPITLIGVLFLIITLGIATFVVADKKYNFNIFEKAGIIECFPAGTKISLSNGEKKNIEDFEIGDNVISDDIIGNKTASQTTKLYKLWSFDMCNINFENRESLKLTSPHPLFTKEGWKAINVESAKKHNPNLYISQLTETDSIKKQDGSWNKINSISCEYGLFRVYNLAVDNNNNYFAEEFLAHNKGGLSIIPREGQTIIYDEVNRTVVDRRENSNPDDGDTPSEPTSNTPPNINQPQTASSCTALCLKNATPDECGCGGVIPAGIILPPSGQTGSNAGTYNDGIIGNDYVGIVANNNNPVTPVTNQPPPAVTQPKTCRGKSQDYVVGAVVVGGVSGASEGYARCTETGWVADCDKDPNKVRLCTITDLTPEFATVPVYLQPEYKDKIDDLIAECTASGRVWLGYQCGTIEQRTEVIQIDPRYREDPVTNIVTEYKDNVGNIVYTDTIHDVDINSTVLQGRGQQVLYTTIKDQDGKIISNNMTPLETQRFSTVEKDNDGFIRDFTTIVRNANTNEILNSLTKSVHTKDLTQIAQSSAQQPSTNIPTQSTSPSFWDTIRNRLNNPNELQGLGTYGLGGGNAYVAPVPMNIIKSSNPEDMTSYIYGNTISGSAGVLTAAAGISVLAPAEALTTVMNIKYVPQILTAADALDSTVTGIACNLGNQDACSYFQASLFIPGFTTPNMLVDTFDDFSSAWSGFGSRALDNIVDVVLPPSSFNLSTNLSDSIIPSGNQATEIIEAVIPNPINDMLFAPDSELVDQRNILNRVTYEDTSIPEAEEIASRLTGTRTHIPAEANIIEPALLRPDNRFIGMPQLPATYGTASVPNPDSDLYKALYSSVAASDLNPSQTHVTNYANTIMSPRNVPQASRFNSRAVAESILALVGVRPVDPSVIEAATRTLERYAPNIPVIPDFRSFSGIADTDIPSFMNDTQIDDLIKNLLDKPESEFITAIDGITIIPSDSPYKVKLDDANVEIPHLSVIIDESGDHFLFVLNDVGNSKVDWTKLPIIENLDNGTFTVDQTVYNLNGPTTKPPTTPLAQRIGDWIDNTIGNNPIINRIIGRPEDINLRPNEITNITELNDEFERLTVAKMKFEDSLPNQFHAQISPNNDFPKEVSIYTKGQDINVVIEDQTMLIRPGENISYQDLTFYYRGIDEAGVPIIEYRNPQYNIRTEPYPLAFDEPLTNQQVSTNLSKMKPGGEFMDAWSDSVEADGLVYVRIDVDANGNIFAFEGTSHQFRKTLVFDVNPQKFTAIEIKVSPTGDYYKPRYEYRIVTSLAQDELSDIAQESLNRTMDVMNGRVEAPQVNISQTIEPQVQPTWFQRTIISPSTGFWDGVRNVGVNIRNGLTEFLDAFNAPREITNTITTDRNNVLDNIITWFNGIGQPRLTNQEIPNITRLTLDDQMGAQKLLDNANQIGETNPRFTETDSTINQKLPPRKVTNTSVKEVIDFSLPKAIKITRNINPAYSVIGLLSLGLADYIVEDVFNIDLFDFTSNTQTTSVGVKIEGNLPPKEIEPVAIVEIIKDVDSLNENDNVAIENSTSQPEFLYYSQKDPEWQDLPTRNGATIRTSGCGIITGGMITGLNPEVYYQTYLEYFKNQGKDRTLDVGGTSWEDHRAVLESMGYSIVPIAGNAQDIKEQIEEYTNNNVPVWINADLYGIGHHVVATGINEENNTIIINDPWRGEGFNMQDQYIDMSYEDGDDGWRVYAIIPPAIETNEGQSVNIDNNN